MLPGTFGEIVAPAAEHAQWLVSGEHEMTVFHRDVEHVALADAERATEVGGEHDAPERVDAPRAILPAHCNPAGDPDMWSVL